MVGSMVCALICPTSVEQLYIHSRGYSGILAPIELWLCLIWCLYVSVGALCFFMVCCTLAMRDRQEHQEEQATSVPSNEAATAGCICTCAACMWNGDRGDACARVVFTFNCSFYPASSVHPVSVLIPHPREIFILRSQIVRQSKPKNKNPQLQTSEMPPPSREASPWAAWFAATRWSTTPVHSDTRKPEARPAFTAPCTCLDDPASLRPLDRDSTATAELVPGALLDYTGTTARVDLIGHLLPYIQDTYVLVPR